MTPVILFDDGRGVLSPLTDFRPAFDIRTGALTTLERLSIWLKAEVRGLIVPEELRAVTAERHNIPVNREDWGTDKVLLVNGRAPLARSVVHLNEREGVWDPESGDLVAACVRGDKVAETLAGSRESMADAADHMRELHAELGLLARPWHVRSMRDRCIMLDLKYLVGKALVGKDDPPLPVGVMWVGTSSWNAAPTAQILPGVVLDCTSGPVLIDDHAIVRPGAVLCGPCYIGPHSIVMDRAIIKANTAIGPWCKVGGEVGGTIFQGYTNKAHDGYLGDSWVGEWANLGAGTTNSNLLNTYGEVIARAAPDGPNERTGEQFLGAIIGDHVKTAICTRIMTGAVMHTGVMWAATAAVSGCVAPFSWVTDAGAKKFRAEKFVEIARAVMGRRKVEMSEEYLRRMRTLLGAGSAFGEV